MAPLVRYKAHAQSGSNKLVVDEDKCIGCGFCAGICPCGVWEMVENV